MASLSYRTAGESHGRALITLIEGMPAGVTVDKEFIDAELRRLLGPDVFAEVLADVPDDWLEPVPGAVDAAALRAAYVSFLTARLGADQWLPVAGEGAA